MLESALEFAFALKRGRLRDAEILPRRRSLYLVLDGEQHRIPRALQTIALRWQALASDSVDAAAPRIAEGRVQI
jgi:hypothetical protein